jgi:hypothetical protein
VSTTLGDAHRFSYRPLQLAQTQKPQSFTPFSPPHTDIHSQRSEVEDDVISIKRVISKDEDERTGFFVDGKPMREIDVRSDNQMTAVALKSSFAPLLKSPFPFLQVKKLIKELNVDIDNLCQFLPQVTEPGVLPFCRQEGHIVDNFKSRSPLRNTVTCPTPPHRTASGISPP